MIKSIRARLQFWYGSILSISMIVFGCLVYWRADRDMHERAIRQAVTTAEYLDLLTRPPGPGPGGGPGGIGGPGRDGATANREGPGPEWIRGGIPGGPLPPELMLGGPPGGPPSRANRQGRGGPLERRQEIESLAADSAVFKGAFGGPRRQTDRMDFVVWRSDGVRLLQSQGPAADQLEGLQRPESDSTGFRLERVENAVRVTLRGTRNSTILVHRPLKEDLTGLHWFGFCIAGLGAVTILIGISGGYFLSRRMVRPIAMISGIASQISVHQLNRRIETTLLDEELIPLARVLNQTFERLEGSFRRLTQFTADASHELRTPLAVIQSQVELALGKRRTVEEYEFTLQTCLKSSDRMRGLVEGLLLLARSDSEHLDLQLQNMDLRQIVEDAVAQCQGHASELGIDLDCVTPESDVPVRVDPRFFVRIPVNLIENALQYTPGNGRVSVEVTTDRGQAILVVRDTGCGISEEQQPRIFDRFFRADTARSRRTGGNGLGLAICRSLAEAHGGTITCSSQSGHGTTMIVQLPLAADSVNFNGSENRIPAPLNDGVSRS